MDLAYRLFIACASVWFIDQCLVKFGIGEPVARAIQIVVIILALIFILVGWYISFAVK